MKLLFDEHLSPRLVGRLESVYPGSLHVADLGLQARPDEHVWAAARQGDFALVTKDADFRRLADRLGPPPVVVLLRLPNCPTATLEARLRHAAEWLPEAVAAQGIRIVELTA